AGAIATGALGLAPGETATDFDGWRRIDLKERLGAGAGRCRTKITSREDLLAAAGDTDLDEQLAVSASGSVEDLLPGMPVTILFGTESGNAELVAEELGTVLGQVPDVEVSDLSSVSPPDLCPERSYRAETLEGGHDIGYFTE